MSPVERKKSGSGRPGGKIARVTSLTGIRKVVRELGRPRLECCLRRRWRFGGRQGALLCVKPKFLGLLTWCVVWV